MRTAAASVTSFGLACLFHERAVAAWKTAFVALARKAPGIAARQWALYVRYVQAAAYLAARALRCPVWPTRGRKLTPYPIPRRLLRGR